MNKVIIVEDSPSTLRKVLERKYTKTLKFIDEKGESLIKLMGKRSLDMTLFEDITIETSSIRMTIDDNYNIAVNANLLQENRRGNISYKKRLHKGYQDKCEYGELFYLIVNKVQPKTLHFRSRFSKVNWKQMKCHKIENIIVSCDLFLKEFEEFEKFTKMYAAEILSLIDLPLSETCIIDVKSTIVSPNVLDSMLNLMMSRRVPSGKHKMKLYPRYKKQNNQTTMRWSNNVILSFF
jgi:hypothetical protein